jgi:ribosome-associated protein
MDEKGGEGTVSHHRASTRVLMDDLPINRRVTIPGRDLRIETSTSSGPGGQRANRVQTRVTLILEFARCDAFSEAHRQLVGDRIGHRIGSDGTIRVTCGRHRRQIANIDEVRTRLSTLLRGAMQPIRVRKATRPTRASTRRRIEAKSRRSAQKRDRGQDWRGGE